MATESITLTREELYARVWSEPMAVLGPALGLSDVGLKKTCARLRIPTPPRGYWARVAAGQKVRKSPLPKLPPNAGAGMRDATLRPSGRERQPAEPVTGPVADQARFEALPENRLVVPDVLTTPHRLVAKTVVALRKAKADEMGRLVASDKQILDVHVTLDSADRAMRVLNTLVCGLEARGFAVAIVTPPAPQQSYGTPPTPMPRTIVRIGDAEIPIRLSEAVTRTVRPPKAGDPSWQPKLYDYTPTGRLALETLDGGLSTRGKWADGTRQRLETMLGDIIVGLVETAEAIRARRERWAEEARQRELEEAKRREKERLAHVENQRIRSLDQFMRRWRKAMAVRAYVAAMREAADKLGHTEHPGLVAWLTWAEGYAQRLAPFGDDGIEYHTDEQAASVYSPWNAPAEDTRPIW
jgi:hypothetical protein